MNDIQKSNAIASFDNCIKRNTLSNSQKHIVNILKKSCEENKVLTREIITNFYIQRYYGDKLLEDPKQKIQVWDGYSVDTVIIEKLYTKSYIRARAISWFKNNMASAILKGKLIVLPVIEI